MGPKPLFLLCAALAALHISFAQNGGGFRSTAKANLDRGIELFGDSKFDSAVIYLQRAVEPRADLLGARGDTIMRLAYTYLMHACMELGQNDSAAVYGHRAIAVARDMRDATSEAYVHYFTGRAYANAGMADYAVDCYRSAYSLGETIKDYYVTHTACIALTGIYSRRENYPLALDYSQRAVNLAKAEGNKKDIAYALTMLGETYARQGRYDDAIGSFREAMGLYEESGNMRLYFAVQSALIAALSKSGRYDEALASIIAPDRDIDTSSMREAFVRAGSYQDLTMQKLMSDLEAKDKGNKFDILHRDYLERQARNLRMRIWLISIVGGLSTVLLFVLYNRQRQKAKAEAAARYAQEKENEFLAFRNESEGRMMRKYIDGLESERSRISKELHDGICNDLLGLEMQLKDRGADAEQTALLHKARENIRDVSHELMPPAFQHASIDEILSDYTARLNKTDNVRVDYMRDETMDWRTLPQKMAFALYRVAQEAAGNSLKHSGADEIKISLTVEDGVVLLEVRDNGNGFNSSERTRGAGLRLMRERVVSVGGILDIETDSTGTAIKTWMGL